MARSKLVTSSSFSSAPKCSICFDDVTESCGRGLAKLRCSHLFHLDCIGSAFNASGVMRCPNCRAIEDGNWQRFENNGLKEYLDDQYNNSEYLNEEYEDDTAFMYEEHNNTDYFDEEYNYIDQQQQINEMMPPHQLNEELWIPYQMLQTAQPPSNLPPPVAGSSMFSHMRGLSRVPAGHPLSLTTLFRENSATIDTVPLPGAVTMNQPECLVAAQFNETTRSTGMSWTYTSVYHEYRFY